MFDQTNPRSLGLPAYLSSYVMFSLNALSPTNPLNSIILEETIIISSILQ